MLQPLNTLLKEKPKPASRPCACGTVIDPIKTAMGWWLPAQCLECEGKEIIKREKEETAKKFGESKARLDLPPRFEKATFETFKEDLQPLAYKTAREYADTYREGKTTKGLYLFGHAGSGKTHLASAIGNQLMLQEGVRFASAPEILLNIKKTFNNQNPQSDSTLLDRLSRTRLLIIDDLGSEKPTEWVQETLFVLIDRRYTHYRPTIITSNLSLDELKDRLGYRIASRIAEMSEVVELRASDYRIRKQK